MHEIKLDILKKINIPVNNEDYKLEVFYDYDKGVINNTFKKLGITSKDFIVCMHVGARPGWKTKYWLPDRWAQVADYLIQNCKAKIVFFGSSYDVIETQKVINNMENKAYSLVGNLDIFATTYLLSKSKLFICTNSGPMNIAAALNKNLVAISLSSPKFWWAPGPNSYNISSESCLSCNKKTCSRYFVCRNQITVEKIINTIKGIRELSSYCSFDK